MFKRDKEVTLQKFFDSLEFNRISQEGYGKTDRYRDFKEVFSTDAGRRVLSHIISEAEGLPVLESEVTDHARLSYRAGKRYLGLWIVKVLNAEPLKEGT